MTPSTGSPSAVTVPSRVPPPTVTVADAVAVPAEAVTTAVPGAWAVTSPSGPTEATSGRSETKPTCSSLSRLPEASRTSVSSWTVPPTARSAEVGSRVRKAATGSTSSTVPSAVPWGVETRRQRAPSWSSPSSKTAQVTRTSRAVPSSFTARLEASTVAVPHATTSVAPSRFAPSTRRSVGWPSVTGEGETEVIEATASTTTSPVAESSPEVAVTG